LFSTSIIKPYPSSIAGVYPSTSRVWNQSIGQSFCQAAVVARFALLGLSLTFFRPLLAQAVPAQALSNLTLANFFTEGWDQTWSKRQTPGGAPDLALLRVQTNFLARDVRFDFLSQQDLNSTKNCTIDQFDTVLSESFNRRIMVLAYGYYEWLNSRTASNLAESSWALATRLQLIDIPGTSLDFNLKALSPTKTLGSDFTTITPSLGGWEDLTPYGLNKVGLYYSVQANNYIGPHTLGAKSVDTAYDLSLAKTWTEPTDPLQNFTTFAEVYSQTDLGGSYSGKTVVTFTPGFRTGLGHNQIFMSGVDLPVSHPRPYNWALRVTYIILF